MCRLFSICCMFLYILAASLCSPLSKRSECYKYNPAVKRLQEYIRINTTNSQNLGLSTKFWKRQARELGLEFAVYRPAGLPICVLTWRGSNPDLPSIMLNSHADVVPVYESYWTYPPFEAHIDEEGNMFGRGTQDTKTTGIQYLEAIRILIENNVVLRRTFHITVMPDEETGGFRGMIPFINSKEFKLLNIGFALDEGGTSPDNTITPTYVDKRAWQMKFTMEGEGGHSLTIPTESSILKLYKLLNMTLKFRDEQRLIQNSKPRTDYGSYSTLNVNIIMGGIGVNVIPRKMVAIVDVRFSVKTTVAESQAMVDSWIQALGNNTTVEFIRKIDRSKATPLDNPFWLAMVDTARDLDLELQPIVCPATSDILQIRNIGIPAFGFGPGRNIISRPHNSDEYMPVEEFLKGIDIYTAMIKKLGNLEL